MFSFKTKIPNKFSKKFPNKFPKSFPKKRFQNTKSNVWIDFDRECRDFKVSSVKGGPPSVDRFREKKDFFEIISRRSEGVSEKIEYVAVSTPRDLSIPALFFS